MTWSYGMADWMGNEVVDTLYLRRRQEYFLSGQETCPYF